MGKIGKHRNPIILILAIIFSLGIYGIIWFVVTLNELRKYRGKGMPGWVILLPIGVILLTL
ncbi:MAG: hypothetical protein K8S87_08800, partial [Planctomycetes bacterium]|nr:hypothetical protein [Planctomycetota bacterium]